MSKRIIVGSHKGGVNKTTITANLAIGLVKSNEDLRVLMVDTDPQANLSKKFVSNYKEKKGLSELLKGEEVNGCIQPTRFKNLDLIPTQQRLSVVKKEMMMAMHGFQQQRLLRALEPVMSKYDYILFDTAPGLDIMTFNVLQFLNGDGLLIFPIIPDADNIVDSDSVEGMNLLLDEIAECIKVGEQIEPKFKVLLTEVDSDEVSKVFAELTKSHFKKKAFEVEIPFSSRNARRKESFEIEKIRTKISRAYKKLVEEITGDFYG